MALIARVVNFETTGFPENEAAGRPDWSKALGSQRAAERQAQNEIRRAAERKGARHG
jgi:hypothetical protein